MSCRLKRDAVLPPSPRLVLVFRHVLELIFRPVRDGMNRAVFVTHDVELACFDCDHLCAEAEKAADINDNSRFATDAVQVGDGADTLVIGTLNGRALQIGLVDCDVRKPFVFAVVHDAVSIRLLMANL